MSASALVCSRCRCRKDDHGPDGCRFVFHGIADKWTCACEGIDAFVEPEPGEVPFNGQFSLDLGAP